MTRRRLKREERKEEIQNHALRIFSEKGFKNTSMQDLAEASGLSAGGLYHHYRSSSEVLYDLMLRGNHYREEMIRKEIREQGKKPDAAMVASLATEKILADNKFIPVYVMFLEALREDERLQILFQKLKAQSLCRFQELIKTAGCEDLAIENWDLISDVINSLLLGAEILQARGRFSKNRKQLERLILALLQMETGKDEDR